MTLTREADRMMDKGFGADRALAPGGAKPVSRPGASRIDHGERRPLRPFGSALPPEIDGRLETPSRITVRPFKLQGTPPCPQCGNNGRFLCECEVE